MMHRAFYQDKLPYGDFPVQRPDKTEIEHRFDVKQVNQQLNGERGAYFSDAGRCEINGVFSRFYLFYFDARNDVLGDDVSEFSSMGVVSSAIAVIIAILIFASASIILFFGAYSIRARFVFIFERD